MIGIVDYNMGNLASVINAFAKVGADASLESDPAKLSQYDKLIFTGSWCVWRCYGTLET